MPRPDRFRAFVCYAHEDEELAGKVHAALTRLDWDVVIDREFGWGRDFRNAIKRGIMRSHLFVPLLTEASQTKPWVHQEIGFAIAVGVAVLPVVADRLEPDQLIASIQAARIDRGIGIEPLADLLNRQDLERLALSQEVNQHAVTQVAFFPNDRVKMLSESAHEISQPARLRQLGGFGSMSIPREPIGNPIWRQRDGESPRDDHYHELLRKERAELARHALGSGYSLIFSPVGELEAAIGKQAAHCRCRVLLEFLAANAANPDLSVRIRERLWQGNLTIVGNWFSAESLAPRAGWGLWHTAFCWHAASVSKAISRFDDEFESLAPITVTDAIARLERGLAEN